MRLVRKGAFLRRNAEVCSRQSHRLGRGPDFSGSGALRQLQVRGRAARTVHQRRAPAHRRFRAADRRHAVHPRRPWHPPDRRRRAGCFGGRAHGGRFIRSACAPAIPSPTRFRAKSGSPLPRAWERFGWPLAWSNSSNRFRTSWSICNARCAPPTCRGTRPTSRSICRGRPRSTSRLVRLGRMHLMFFASQKYIETYGAPQDRRANWPSTGW